MKTRLCRPPASCICQPGPNTAWRLQGELPRGSVTLDTSVSGNTVYMEPKPVVALNNAEALLAGQEQEEELAILAELSRQVSEDLCLLVGLSPGSRLSVPGCTPAGLS